MEIPDYIKIKIKLKNENQVWVNVNGKSMEPTLHNGDKVLVKKSDFEYRAGDIVVFQINKKLVIHRILRVSTIGIQCKGDNAVIIDIIQINDIYGKVIRVNCLENMQYDICNNKYLFLLCRLLLLISKYEQKHPVVKATSITLIRRKYTMKLLKYLSICKSKLNPAI